MDDNEVFDGLIIFCAVADTLGFSSAALRLGHTPSHVSKEIARLEQRLGARLFNRTTRSVSLTEAGQRFHRDARQLVADAKLAERRLRDLSTAPTGDLKISVPVAFARSWLDDWLGEFLKTYPEIRLDMEASERLVDIVAEGFDVVVRAGYLDDSDLVAKKLATSRRIIVASPDYLDRNGVPKTPEDLIHHQIIDFSMRKSIGQWSFIDRAGKRRTVSLSPRVECNSAETEEALAADGIGITALPEFACARAISQGRLVPILEDYEEPPIGLYAIYPSRRQLAAKVRVFVDFLATKMRSNFAQGNFFTE